MASVRFGNRSTAPNPVMPEVPWSAAPRPRTDAAPIPPSFGYQPPATPAPPPPSSGDGSIWQGYTAGETSPTPGPGATMPSMGNYWNDPMLQQYTDFATQAMGRLSDPNMGGPNNIMSDAINKLQTMFQQGQSGYGQFQDIANRRLEQLKSPLFGMGSSADTPDAMQNSALLRSKFLEPLVQQRDASQRRALERASSRGLGLTSGLTEELARGVDNQFDQSMTQGYRDLMLQEVQANEGREQEAVSIGQLLASLAGNPAQMGAASGLAGIGNNLQGEDTRNLLSSVGISQNLAQLPLQQMMATGSMMGQLNSQPLPQADSTMGLIQMLLQMTGQGEGAMNNAMNQEGSFWSQLFGALPGMFPQNQPPQAGGG
jgi:hypothetical protein